MHICFIGHFFCILFHITIGHIFFILIYCMLPMLDCFILSVKIKLQNNRVFGLFCLFVILAQLYFKFSFDCIFVQVQKLFIKFISIHKNMNMTFLIIFCLGIAMNVISPIKYEFFPYAFHMFEFSFTSKHASGKKTIVFQCSQ